MQPQTQRPGAYDGNAHVPLACSRRRSKPPGERFDLMRLISPRNLPEICRYFRPNSKGLDLRLERCRDLTHRATWGHQGATWPSFLVVMSFQVETGGRIPSWRAACCSWRNQTRKPLPSPEYHPVRLCHKLLDMEPKSPDRARAVTVAPNGGSTDLSIPPRLAIVGRRDMCNPFHVAAPLAE
jgi:hypothetical protein